MQRESSERSYSTDGRSRICLLDGETVTVLSMQDESERRTRPFSKSLSKEELPDATKDRTRKLNRLVLLLNKKLRMIRYFFFVKLETLKKLGLKISQEVDAEQPPKQLQKTAVAVE